MAQLKRWAKNTMSLQLSPRLQNKVALIAEISRGPVMVALVLKNKERIYHVQVSKDSVIEKIGEKEIKQEHDLEFLMSQIQDLDLDIIR